MQITAKNSAKQPETGKYSDTLFEDFANGTITREEYDQQLYLVVEELKIQGEKELAETMSFFGAYFAQYYVPMQQPTKELADMVAEIKSACEAVISQTNSIVDYKQWAAWSELIQQKTEEEKKSQDEQLRLDEENRKKAENAQLAKPAAIPKAAPEVINNGDVIPTEDVTVP